MTPDPCLAEDRLVAALGDLEAAIGVLTAAVADLTAELAQHRLEPQEPA